MIIISGLQTVLRQQNQILHESSRKKNQKGKLSMFKFSKEKYNNCLLIRSKNQQGRSS